MPDDAELHDLHAGGKPTARLIALAVLVIVLIWFGVANRTEVKVSFIVVHSKVRLIYALAVAAILGALVDRLATLIRRRR